MRTLYLTNSIAGTSIGKAGATLHLINAALLDYSATLLAQATLTLSPILVGFDTTPSPGNHDGVIPPNCEALLHVPSSVQQVILVVPTTPSGQIVSALPVQVEWLDLEVATTIRPVHQGAPVIAGTNAQNPAVSLDQRNNYWPFDAVQPVLDQGLEAKLMSSRPHLAPSSTKTFFFAGTTADALNSLPGVQGSNAGSVPSNLDSFTPQWKVLLKAYFSTNSQMLIVLGDGTLVAGTGGPVGAGEVWRGRVNLYNQVDFGEGIELNFRLPGIGLPWQVYTEPGGRLDCAFLLG
ncbi:MAG: hypothetical protein ACYDCL_21505 [Myxococcales bacterium]